MEKRIARLLEQVERTQDNCSFDDLARLLKAIGYTMRATSGRTTSSISPGARH